MECHAIYLYLLVGCGFIIALVSGESYKGAIKVSNYWVFFAFLLMWPGILGLMLILWASDMMLEED